MTKVWQVWRMYGESMVEVWRKYGSSMAKSMVKVWQKYGKGMAQLAILWPIYGCHTFSEFRVWVWEQFAILWPIYGDPYYGFPTLTQIGYTERDL